jgi:AraC-like DNA-binding protein|tara:strand:- start:4752 stop:5171 length:420 start_codon:yes stop_codon:yes gene_type:complete
LSSEEYQDQNREILDDSMKNCSKININSKDKEWVDELILLVEGSFSDRILNVEELAVLIFISSRQLNRKLKYITGLTVGKFIQAVKLQAARKELEGGTFIAIAEVAYTVEFENQSNFSRVFKNRFGKTPSEYLKLDVVS